MPSHLSNIGFRINSQDEFQDLAFQACAEGEALPVDNGVYIKWALGEGIELWVQLDKNDDIVGVHPHFRGWGQMCVGLTREIFRPESAPMDAAFYAWANPSFDDPESGEFPFVFDVPNHRLCDIQLPAIVPVQLAAFADELQSYQSDQSFQDFQSPRIKLASESFIPSGLFVPGGKKTDPPSAHAIFSGHVLDTSIITNPATGNDFCWAKVRTLGGEVDVVADPVLLNGLIVEGGVLSGSFWLSGVLL